MFCASNSLSIVSRSSACNSSYQELNREWQILEILSRHHSSLMTLTLLTSSINDFNVFYCIHFYIFVMIFTLLITFVIFNIYTCISYSGFSFSHLLSTRPVLFLAHPLFHYKKTKNMCVDLLQSVFTHFCKTSSFFT